MAYEKDRAQSILGAIPYMSKEIVDDTLYEKVLSFLDYFAAKDPSHVSLFTSWGLLDILKQACEMPDQDYRVHTLCFRLLGRLIACGGQEGSRVFRDTRDSYPELLDRIVLGGNSSEPALRCASLEAYRGFIHCLEGAEWLLHNDTVKQAMASAFVDDSAYVFSESCKFFCAVLQGGSDSDGDRANVLKALCNVLNPASQLKQVLRPDIEAALIIPGLEYCWSLADARTSAVLDYVTREKIFVSLLSLLKCDNRLVRARVLEILSVLLEWAPNPLVLLDDGGDIKDGDGYELKRGYDYLCSVYQTMLAKPGRQDTVLTAVSLMESTLVLLQRFAKKDAVELGVCEKTLLDLLCIGIGKKMDTLDPQFSNVTVLLEKGLRSHYARRNFVQPVLSALNTFVTKFPFAIKDTRALDTILSVLGTSSISSDQRVLKLSLGAELHLLRNFADTNPSSKMKETVSHAVNQFIQMLNEADMDCRSIALIFEAFDAILEHESLGQIVTEPDISAAFVSALQLKFIDTEWDIRDAAVNFVGALFKKPISPIKTTFALGHNLPLLVMDRINDHEPYVRASALDVLQNLMQSSNGWAFIQRNQKTREIANKLPSFLYDSEAFVRRAALDTIACLVTNRSCEGMVIESEPSKDQSTLNPEIAAKLMDDPDSEVRIRMCSVFSKLWALYLHEKEQQKKTRPGVDNQYTDPLPIFYALKGDSLVITAAGDTQRLVRAQAYETIRYILGHHVESNSEDSHGGKRALVDMDERDQRFLEALSRLDMNRLEQSMHPEHLYQEAFDINASMMTRSLQPMHPDDDTNMLDCY